MRFRLSILLATLALTGLVAAQSLLSLHGIGQSGARLPSGLADRWSFKSLALNDGDLIDSVSSSVRSNAMTASGSARPVFKTGSNGLNGRGIALFDGTSDTMSCSTSPHTTDCSIFIIGKINSAAAASNFLLTGNASGIGVAAYDPAVGNLLNVYARAVANGSSGSSSLGWTLIEVHYTAGSCEVVVNGTAVATHTYTITTATGGARLGKGDVFNYWLNGYIADVLVWNRKLTSTERSLVRTLLQSEWGGIY